MILALYSEEGSDRAVNALEVNITVFMLLLSLMGKNEEATATGHGGHAGFLLPVRLGVFILHTNHHQLPSSIM